MSIRYLIVTAALSLCQSVQAENLSQHYPDDKDIDNNPAVLLHDDFEAGWRYWDYPASDSRYLKLQHAELLANSGERFLRSTVTEDDLNHRRYISSVARHTLKQPSDEIFLRFYTRMNADSPPPHHWIKIAATDGDYDVRGKANTLPQGDKAFWITLDINNRNLLSFYTYWYKMRSGRCDDGTATPGCKGDQGNTYYYGNKFSAAKKTPLERARWNCIEIHAKANTIGKKDGELSLWINDELVENFRPGHPDGSWLRARFFTDNCHYLACTEPKPFEGFDFRSSDKVKFRQIFLDAYNQKNTFARKKKNMLKNGIDVIDTQMIDYDDLVVATERIGCMKRTAAPVLR